VKKGRIRKKRKQKRRQETAKPRRKKRVGTKKVDTVQVKKRKNWGGGTNETGVSEKNTKPFGGVAEGLKRLSGP